jgi:hypothetical protein
LRTGRRFGLCRSHKPVILSRISPWSKQLEPSNREALETMARKRGPK